MIEIKKRKEPSVLTEYKKDPTASYRNMHGAFSGKWDSEGNELDVYHMVLNSLMEEQGHICAYCMRRIPEKRGNTKASIEHISPQSKTDKLKALDYNNMLAVCSGNRDAGSLEEKTCDACRGNQKLDLNPTKKATLSTIRYRSNGRIYSDDENINRQLDKVLNLNCKSRDLIRLRKSALNQMQVMIKRKKQEGNKEYYKKLLEMYQQNSPQKSEYVGILIYWLEKQLLIK